MKAIEVQPLVEKLGDAKVCVVVLDPADVEDWLKTIREAGYAAYVRTTAMGTEVVITDCLSDQVARNNTDS